MVRINTTGVQVPLQPQSSSAKSTAQAATVGEQVQQALFGRAKPPVLDPSQFPHLAEQMAMLDKARRKLALMQEEDEEAYQLVLAEGTIAMIDSEGKVYVGREFLEAKGDDPAVLLGVLAHEIGHRPKRWKQYKGRHELSYEELQALCRHEETRADAFSGRALAELGYAPDNLCQFLHAIDDGPHPDYWPAEDRARVVRESHGAQAERMKGRKSIFPEYDRMTAPKGHIGEA